MILAMTSVTTISRLITTAKYSLNSSRLSAVALTTKNLASSTSSVLAGAVPVAGAGAAVAAVDFVEAAALSLPWLLLPFNSSALPFTPASDLLREGTKHSPGSCVAATTSSCTACCTTEVTSIWVHCSSSTSLADRVSRCEWYAIRKVRAYVRQLTAYVYGTPLQHYTAWHKMTRTSSPVLAGRKADRSISILLPPLLSTCASYEHTEPSSTTPVRRVSSTQAVDISNIPAQQQRPSNSV